MSAERKKLIWISLSACVFVLVLAATGLYLFAPKKGGSSAPATAGNIAVPKAADPQDFLFSPPAAPTFEEPRAPGDDLVIVYGDKPTGGPAFAGENAATSPAAAAPLPATAPAPRSTDAIPPKAVAPLKEPAAPAAKPTATPAKAATVVAPATKPAPAKSAAPKAAAPAAKSAPKTKTEYWIQVASFSSRGRADELKDTIAAKQVAALISVKDLDGKSYYRVRIGPYSAKAEADGWIERIKAIPGCESAMVMQTTVEVKN